LGKLLYGGSAMEIEIDDRSLAHLQIAIGVKLRNGERFFLSWRDDAIVGGRSSLWIDHSIPLFFKFVGTKRPTINRAWIDALILSAVSASGMAFTPEPGDSGVGTPLPTSRV
jgi:hypothetical protein